MSDFRTPLKRALGSGSARGGTAHFIAQRATAIALVPLALWAVWLALALVHADYAQAQALLRRPFSAVCLGLFVVALFWHANLGLQVVIEDYVHDKRREIAAQLVVRFACILGALLGVFAIARVALA